MSIKQFTAIILALAVSAGSAFAVATPVQTSTEKANISTLSDDNDVPEILSAQNTNPSCSYSHVLLLTHCSYKFPSSDPIKHYFRIYRTANGKTTDITDTKYLRFINSTNYATYQVRDRSVTNGTYYTYQMVTVIPTRSNGTYTYTPQSYSNKISIYYLRPAGKFDDISIKNSTNGKIMTISWGRNSKADGYDIQYSTKESWDNAVIRKITSNRTTTLKLKNRTPDKQYQVRVRSYKKYKGKTWYSGWTFPELRYDSQNFAW